jgi:hypothetical protein
VTVGGVAGGTTVQGGTAQTTVANAAAVCSSLSSQACYGIQEQQCTNFGSGGATGTGNVVTTTGNLGPRQTPCPGVLYVAGAGVVYGAMRGVV